MVIVSVLTDFFYSICKNIAVKRSLMWIVQYALYSAVVYMLLLRISLIFVDKVKDPLNLNH